ncbi:streptomycin 6-kinase [Peribacillus deserti]|uniref:Streptomycin 6-kinase n=1 Tax=Peribacillus deserti TaxID=673318 RepID=A0ABS2QEJ6_9BACI|nr:aminoglycoside phosphotransferase family protein [Peribacillus deserti]MBM7691420.1 streptomycin 6-kinase [Peribacillus deserti]
MLIPDLFKKKIMGAFGAEGEAWLSKLETRVQEFVGKWSLTIEGPVSNLSYNYVLKARDQEGKPVILKLGVPGFDFQNEIHTLQVYNGEGFARLLKADGEKGALLLEQLRPGIMLSEEKDETLAVHYFLDVWMAIRRPVPPGISFPSIMDWASGLNRYLEAYPNGEGPITSEYITHASELFKEIHKTSEGDELLHGDLHHENILFSHDRGWLAIDPKGVSGDPYFGLSSYLINHLFDQKNPKELLSYRINLLTNNSRIDRERLLKAAAAMSVLYACWGIEDNDPEWKNTFECARWFEEFGEMY